jgi:hypothetical protein
LLFIDNTVDFLNYNDTWIEILKLFISQQNNISLPFYHDDITEMEKIIVEIMQSSDFLVFNEQINLYFTTTENENKKNNTDDINEVNNDDDDNYINNKNNNNDNNNNKTNNDNNTTEEKINLFNKFIGEYIDLKVILNRLRLGFYDDVVQKNNMFYSDDDDDNEKNIFEDSNINDKIIDNNNNNNNNNIDNYLNYNNINKKDKIIIYKLSNDIQIGKIIDVFHPVLLMWIEAKIINIYFDNNNYDSTNNNNKNVVNSYNDDNHNKINDNFKNVFLIVKYLELYGSYDFVNEKINILNNNYALHKTFSNDKVFF